MRYTRVLFRTKKRGIISPKLPSIIPKPGIIAPKQTVITPKPSVITEEKQETENTTTTTTTLWKPRRHDNIKDLKELTHKGIYHPKLSTLVVGEHNYESSARLGRVIGGSSNIWATSPHAAGTIRGARYWSEQLQNAHGRYNYEVDPLHFTADRLFKGVKFNRVVLYLPKGSSCSYDQLGSFLLETKDVITDYDELFNGQIHLLLPESAPQVNYELEQLAVENGVFCNTQTRIPWGGRKKDHFFYVVSFVFTVELGRTPNRVFARVIPPENKN